MRVEGLVDAAEREAHLRQRLVAHPLLGDGPHLRDERPALLGQRDHAERDALLARLVQRGAHVLPRLAPEFEIGEVDEGVLGHLHALPAEHGRRVGGLLGDREEARHPAAALAHPGVLQDGVAPLGRRPHRVAEADRDACVALVGDEGVALAWPEPGVLRPGRHPGQRAAAALLQQLRRGRAVDLRARGAAAQPPPQRHPEGRTPDHEHEEERGPHQLVGGEARNALFDVDVAAEDGDEDADHRDEDADGDVDARDDDGEPPGEPLAVAQASDEQQGEDQGDAEVDEILVVTEPRAERAVVREEVRDDRGHREQEQHGHGEEAPLTPAGPARGRGVEAAGDPWPDDEPCGHGEQVFEVGERSHVDRRGDDVDHQRQPNAEAPRRPQER